MAAAVSGHVGALAQQPLRICMLAACPFPANHGTPGSIREMSEALAEAGHEVHIVTYHHGEDIPVRGPRVHRVRRLTRESATVVGPTIRRPLYDLQMVFKTLAILRRHPPHLLHAHGYEAALVASACRAITRCPVVYSAHNTMSDELPSYGFIRPQWLATRAASLLDAVVPLLADRCLPHSSNVERFLHDRGLAARTDPVINFGIDTQWMSSGDGAGVRERYRLGSAPVLMYAGVLDHFQRIDLLLEATRLVARSCPAVKLVMVVTVAQAQHLARVRALVDQLDLSDRVVITEPQPLDTVRDFLHAADVAVVPRPGAPGFPIKLLNYMAAGRASVLFASSASAGVTDGETALLASPDTADALARAILALIEDPALRDAIARNGQAFVQRHHDRRTIATDLAQCYQRVLGQQQPRRDECHAFSS